MAACSTRSWNISRSVTTGTNELYWPVAQQRRCLMSWYSKVAWAEGLFLRPHHLQQSDRYLEHLLESRVRHISPYPWGFSHLEIDRDLAQQSKFAVRRAAGIMPDGTPFDIPDTASGQIAWLSMPVAAPNTREIDDKSHDSASRYVRGAETCIDSTSE